MPKSVWSLHDAGATAAAGGGGGKGTTNNKTMVMSSLVDRCKSVIVSNLEKYKTDAIGVLSEYEWESIVELRHQKTQPKVQQKQGSTRNKYEDLTECRHNNKIGGLDGTGRAIPAVSDKFLLDIEQSNPHLAESALVDTLVWRDCVSYRYKQNGLTRPKPLLYPWPLLLQYIGNATSIITDPALLQHYHSIMELSPETQQTLENAIYILREAPMDISLLKDSGVGKAMKKLIKSCKKKEVHGASAAKRNNATIFHQLLIPELYANTASTSKTTTSTTQVTATSIDKPRGKPGCPHFPAMTLLEQMYQSWVDMATNNGVKMKASPHNTSKTASTATTDNSGGGTVDHSDDLKLAKSCTTWRQLFLVLKSREEQRREFHGAKMREIRNNLNNKRGKVKKVTATAKRTTKYNMSSKLGRLFNEANVVSRSRASSSSTGTTQHASRIRMKLTSGSNKSKAANPTGFAAAVAFASASKPILTKRKAPPGTHLRTLGRGKVMKTPLAKHHNRGHGTKTAQRKNKSMFEQQRGQHNR